MSRCALVQVLPCALTGLSALMGLKKRKGCPVWASLSHQSFLLSKYTNLFYSSIQCTNLSVGVVPSQDSLHMGKQA